MGVATQRAVPPIETKSVSAFGMIVFLASDVMVFAAFFAAYFLLRSTNDPWPANGVELDVPRAVAATAALVGSSFTMVAGERAHHRGEGH